jgi:hypothetical protein
MFIYDLPKQRTSHAHLQKSRKRELISRGSHVVILTYTQTLQQQKLHIVPTSFQDTEVCGVGVSRLTSSRAHNVVIIDLGYKSKVQRNPPIGQHLYQVLLNSVD